MNREGQIAERVVAKYPDSQPTEPERKKWREQAEKRRRKEGIRPRKAYLSIGEIIRNLENAVREVTNARHGLLIEMCNVEEAKRMLRYAEKIDEEVEKLTHLCLQEIPVTASRNIKSSLPIRFRVVKVTVDAVSVSAGEFDSDEWRSGSLEEEGRRVLEPKIRRLESGLSQIGMFVSDWNVQADMQHTGLGFGKGPFFLTGIIYIGQNKPSLKLVEQVVYGTWG